MDNAIGDKDVRDHNTGTVDVYVCIHDAYGDVVALHCLERGTVHQVSTVADCAVDNVVGEDFSDLFSGEVGEELSR